MSFIEVLAIISDFYFVFIVTAALIGVVVYLIRDIFRGKLDEPKELSESELKLALSCVHIVKTSPEHFEGIINGTKPFEFRKNDRRRYKPGDCVCINECIIDEDDGFKREIITERYCFVVIKEIFELGSIDPALSEYVVFTFSVLKIVEGEEE
ncbi:MAG: DUF3850 domain-containing protein [Clostridia bacterium]|nr:DUF3850 domain-containing protein [Clostridia bacterium]